MASGRSDLPGWVWDHETAGGGMMMYNGIHSLDRLAWLAGSPIARVSGAMGTFCYPVADEDSAVGTVTFRNGALGVVIQHKSDAPATLAGWQTTVYGTNGGIQLTSGSGLQSDLRQGAYHASRRRRTTASSAHSGSSPPPSARSATPCPRAKTACAPCWRSRRCTKRRAAARP